MILLYKVLKNYFNSDFSSLYIYSTTTTTRGHCYKLFKFRTRLNCRTNYIFNRLVNDWNNLPDFIVNANSVINFKSSIDIEAIYLIVDLILHKIVHSCNLVLIWYAGHAF